MTAPLVQITNPPARMWVGNPLTPVNAISLGGSGTGPDPGTGVGPSGIPAPTADLPNFTLIKSEGFDIPAATGEWPTLPYYRPWWRTYSPGTHDTTPGKGLYDDATSNSVANSCLRARLFYDPARATSIVSVSTFSTVADATSSIHSGQVYGRYSMCMRATQTTGTGGMYKVVPLLWPNSGVWPGDGEEDFPEKAIGVAQPVKWFHHLAQAAGGQEVFVHPTALLSDWHVYTLEWTPNLLKAYVDGVLLGQSTNVVPSTSMRWTWQFETQIVSSKSGLTSAGNTITATAHGLVNGNTIKFTNVDTATGIDTTTLYYIVSAATDTFRVSTTLNGTAITLGTANLLSVLQYPAPEDECLVEVDWGAMWRYTPGSTGTPDPTVPDPMPTTAITDTAIATTWVPLTSEDFLTNVPLGGFNTMTTGSDLGKLDPATPGGAAYATKWKAKTNLSLDTDGNARYSALKTMSVANSVLDIWLHSEAGQAYGSAMKPLLPPGAVDANFMTYGRIAFRMRSTGLIGTGYGLAALLINSNAWPTNGEHDWPEARLDSTVKGFYHPAQATNTSIPVSGGTEADGTARQMSAWHTYVVEWFPVAGGARLRWYVDGDLRYDTTSQVAIAPMTLGWLIQVASNGGVPAATAEAHLQIDWYSIWTWSAA